MPQTDFYYVNGGNRFCHMKKGILSRLSYRRRVRKKDDLKSKKFVQLATKKSKWLSSYYALI